MLRREEAMAVYVEKSGPVTTVINDRINARNAGDPETADALVAAFLAFDKDKDARVAVFWGAGGAFCAGWDLKYAAKLADRGKFQKEIVEDLAFPPGSAPAPRGPLGPSRLELSKPVIAAVEGPAVAGGMELALWCDVRVMAEDAYFGVYCRRWGIPLVDGGTVRLPRLVGLGRAMEIVLTGRKVPAEEAYRIGLCEKVVPKGQARQAAEAMAQEIARFPQAATLADRRNLYEGHGLTVREALKREWANAIDAHIEEGTEGAARFAAGKGRHGDFGSI
jgi:enoyl-CoA hydratase